MARSVWPCLERRRSGLRRFEWCLSVPLAAIFRRLPTAARTLQKAPRVRRWLPADQTFSPFSSAENQRRASRLLRAYVACRTEAAGLSRHPSPEFGAGRLERPGPIRRARRSRCTTMLQLHRESRSRPVWTADPRFLVCLHRTKSCTGHGDRLGRRFRPRRVALHYLRNDRVF